MRKFENIGRIWVFVRDPKKKNIFLVIKEVMVLMVLKKEIPLYYFKFLYKNGVQNYKDYLGRKECLKILHSKRLHKRDFAGIIDNKLNFSLFHENTDIRVPELLGYNFGPVFCSKRGNTEISDKNSLLQHLEKILLQSGKDAIFFRPLAAYGGKGCFKLLKNQLKQEVDQRFDTLINGNYVHSEVIAQHPEINKIHANSVNTLRIISLITSDNEIEIVSANIRFGVGESVVDNGSSGGFGVGIRIEDGTLKDTGHFMVDFGGSEIDTHPTSGYRFGGFKVPFFKEACDEVIKAVRGMPEGFVGWDVAISPDGPVIIEANTGPHLPTVDIMYGGILRNRHMKKLLSEL